MESMVGKRTDKYTKLEEPIECGGFGNVYKLSGKLAVKEEFKVCSCIKLSDLLQT